MQHLTGSYATSLLPNVVSWEIEQTFYILPHPS